MKKYNKHFLMLTVLLSLSIITVTAQNNDSRNSAQKFAATLFYIDNFYVDTVAVDKLTEDAIVAMLKKLDPHSAYISKKDLEAANEPLVGSFEGIGVTFQLVRDTILVVSPVSGGPSEKVGVMAGDKIVKIDGELSVGKKVDNKYVADHLRGPKGSKVTVSVKRGSNPELIDFEISRDKIPLNSIDGVFMLDDGVGYIKLNHFAQTTMDEFGEAMKKLQGLGLESLVLDLRGNSGGYLNTAFELADEFLPEDKLIVYTEGCRLNREEYRSTKKGSFEKGNLVVLIDEGSASASEIVSGAIQDWDRGVLIGRRSFGKGLVQRPFNLPDGSQMRLTTSRYFTPTGRCIQRSYEKGSEDYFLEMTKRLNHGEYYNADSIHFPDSLKYHTNNGRIVYGGGGIMPDIFMPVDTNLFSTLYSNLVRKGVFNRYTLDYVMINRDKLKDKYSSFEKYNRKFDVSDKMMTDFIAFAEKEGVKWNEEQYEKSKRFLQAQIKALIARNIWPVDSYYQVMVSEDEVLQKAISILNNNKVMSEILK